MASLKKITDIIAAIKVIYPYYAKDTDVPVLVNTWSLLLNDYPDKAVDEAVKLCLKSCKMPPTPADVIEKLDGMIESTDQSPEKMWGIFCKALDEVEKQRYRIMYPLFNSDENPREKITETWESLPERLKDYIGSKGELMRMSDYTSDDLKFEKNRFFKSMAQIRKREQFAEVAALIGVENLLIEGK